MHELIILEFDNTPHISIVLLISNDIKPLYNLICELINITAK